MNLRIKTVRRLLIIAAVGVVIVLAGLAIRQANEARREARRQADRDAGIAAFQRGDFPAALERLSNYVRRDTTDREALLAYASSRAKVELPGGRHLSQAIASFELLRSIDPADRHIQKSLLELYTQAGYSAEAIALADAVLATHPDDANALRAKSIALWRTARFDAALKASLALNDVAPLSLADHLQTYSLLRKTGTPPELIVQRYETLLSRHPDDPRFELLLGVACGDAGDRDRALALLRSAAARVPPDADFVARLAQIFDQQRLFSDAAQLLTRAAQQSSDPAILRILVQRLWQAGDYHQVLKRLESIDPASPTSDSTLIAFAALSHLALNQSDAGKALIDSLRKRTGDNVAQAWAAAMQARLESARVAPPQLIARYHNALSRGQDNGIIRFWIGQAHQSLGETEQAIKQWEQAAALMPSWSAPHVQIARAELARGNLANAATAAEAAVRCSTDPVALATWAMTRYAVWRQNPTPEEQHKLSAMVSQIRKANPDDNQTLPLHAALLCREGKHEQAKSLIAAELPRAADWTPEVLGNLIAVSREFALGLDEAILQATRDVARTNPDMALRHAIETALAGHPAEASKALQDAVARAPAEQALRWQIALAQFREATNDPEAVATWKTLADAHPDDFAVQSLILRSAGSLRRDRDFAFKTVERVRKIGGEDSTLWRAARVRLLLSGQPTHQDSAEAVGHLAQLIRLSPSSVEYRVLLAQAQENLGNTRDAAEQLQAAVEIDPRATATQLELARLLHELGRYADAARYLERAAANPNLEPSHRLPLAELLAAQGKTAPAISVLESVPTREVPAELLLARLYYRAGRDADAEQVYTRLLSAADPAPELLADAADFFASRGDIDRGRSILSRLPAVAMPTSRREAILAAFKESYGDRDAARQRLVDAADATPHDPAAWRNLAMFHLRAGDYDSALAALERGAAHVADPAELSGLKLQVAAMQRVSEDPTDLSPLIEVLSREPGRQSEAQALRAMQEARSTTQPAAAQVARLRQAADRFPQFLPLQAMAAHAHLRAGQNDDAVTIAYRLLDTLGGNPNALAAATEIFRATRQWGPMASAAQRWRQHSRGRTDADAALAEAQLRLGRPTDALATLQPRLTEALANPESHARVLEIAARTHVATGDVSQARSLLIPFLPKSPAVRSAWLRIVSDTLADPSQASQWLDEVRLHIDLRADPQRIEFARHSLATAMRLGTRTSLPAALELVEPLANGDTPNEDAMFLLASIQLQLDRLAEAEAGYRALLARRPGHPAAANDLAWILLTQKRQLPEAQKLARQAVAASPDVASFHETLARIEGELGDYTAALAAFDATLRLAPSSVDALIGKAFVLRQSGRTAEARRLLAQIEPLLPAAPPMPEIVRRQLSELKQELSRGD